MIDRRAPGSRSARGGMALILTMVLIGVVAALTVSAQMSMVIMLRQARLRQFRTMLRLAASDAALCAARQAAAEQASGKAGAGNAASPAQAVTPSGIKTEIQTRSIGKTEAAYLPIAHDLLAEDPKLVLIESKATSSNIVEQVSCLIGKDTGGKTRIVGWLENR